MLWLPIVAAVFLIVGLWTGRYLSRHSADSAAQEKLRSVFETIERYYVDEVGLDSLVDKALPELLRNLDPHSTYISAKDRVVADRDLEGSFFGVGIQFQMMNDTLYIVEVINGGAAERAGIQPGDKIIEVDGKNIAGMNVGTEEVFGMLRGPKDTDVQVKVKRHGSAAPISFDLVRAEVPVSPIDASYMIADSIGYVRLGKFSENTYPEFLRSLVELTFDGAKSFILDLRGNGGGYMNPAVLIANEFFNGDATIVMTKGRHMVDNTALMADMQGSFANSKLVVLIDEYTASSSEILAGAIQDNDRGLVIGRRSFGKGLVQRQFELPDSSEFRLTVQRYYTPSGRCIQKSYTPGNNYEYAAEVYDRWYNGELFEADSAKIDTTQMFTTKNGRVVYGGGGIMPDIFVPTDTVGITSYFTKVANAGLIRNFAYEYADLNRENLAESVNTAEMLSKLPGDYTLLQSFVQYASAKGGIAPRWYYINISAPLIVNQIKALIARDIIGMDGYFEVVNSTDPVVKEAVKRLEAGDADFPVEIGRNIKKDQQ